MKQFLTLSVITISAGMFVTSCSPTGHAEVAKGVNFSNYKTFAWTNDNGVKKSGRVNNDIVDNNIKNSVGAELEKKGWTETEQQPDVLLDYNVMVETVLKQETFPTYSYPYSGYYHSWRGRRLGYYYTPNFFTSYHVRDVPVKEGTLTVNMMDARTNKLIWQGWAKGDITAQTITSQQAEGEVKSIFRKLNFPKD